MSVYLDIKSLYPHLKVNWNVLMCKICIARRLVVDIFPWCNANFVPFPSGTLVAHRMRNGSIGHAFKQRFDPRSVYLSKIKIGNCKFSRRFPYYFLRSFRNAKLKWNLVNLARKRGAVFHSWRHKMCYWLLWCNDTHTTYAICLTWFLSFVMTIFSYRE